MLVGRELESARLDEVLDTARGGRSAALILRGEAGIGKRPSSKQLSRGQETCASFAREASDPK
jgi:predicted ATPase